LKQRDWIVISLLVLGWIIFVGQPTSLSAQLRHLLVRLATPLAHLGNLIPTVESRRALARENQQLQSENDVLRQRLRALDETVRENQRLQRLLDMKGRVSQRTVAARVIGRDASNWFKSIQIDRGLQDGIQPDMPVATAGGLVGKTVAVTKGESRVLLLSDPTCKVSALVGDSREPGVVAGAAVAFSRQPYLEMTYVDRAADIQPGQQVISSGLGGIFPKGILIGTVLQAQLDSETGMYQDLEVEPAVDLRRVEEVIVILNRS
jgi:rod shape-determining protein MreC